MFRAQVDMLSRLTNGKNCTSSISSRKRCASASRSRTLACSSADFSALVPSSGADSRGAEVCACITLNAAAAVEGRGHLVGELVQSSVFCAAFHVVRLGMGKLRTKEHRDLCSGSNFLVLCLCFDRGGLSSQPKNRKHNGRYSVWISSEVSQRRARARLRLPKLCPKRFRSTLLLRLPVDRLP